MNDQAHGHQRRLPPAERWRAQDSSRDDLIIGAALELLAEKGYHSLTMTDVAARAGCRKRRCINVGRQRRTSLPMLSLR
jgi:hypothetical protein